MLGIHPIEAALGATYDRRHLKTILGAMADAGLAVFFLQHLEKDPAPEQVIAPATLKKMKAAGENLGHGLATSDKPLLQRWLKRWQDTHDEDTHPNVGLSPSRSRLLIVDVDTAEEKRAFLDYWAEAEGWATDPNSNWPEADITPTVLTPGDHDAEGNLIHSDGGHYYFTLPEGWEVPQSGPGVLKMPGGWAIYMRGCYVLAPPSVRAEGQYKLAGIVHAAPPWLLELAGSKQRLDPVSEAPTPGPDTSGDDSSSVTPAAADTPVRPTGQTIDDWASNQSWDDLLTSREFLAFKPDTCGDDCTIYTDVSQPHASRKSATAHGAFCSQYDKTMGHGPLHFWTDNAPDGFVGKGTYSMLQFVAIKDYDGDIGKALDALGIDYGSAELKALEKRPTERTMVDLVDKEDIPDRIIWPASHYKDTPPPQPLIDGYLFKHSHAMLIGAPGAGKSLVGLDWAACISTGRDWYGHDVTQGPVVYVAGEAFPGFVRRIHAWADGNDVPEVWDKLHLVRDPYSIPADERQVDAVEWWRRFVDQAAELKPSMIVLDTLARVTVGLKENDASDMGMVIEQFDQIIDHVSTSVLLVHHTARGSGHARGSTALLGSVDSEFLVKPDADMPKTVITLETTKQKDAERLPTMSLAIVKKSGSVYVSELNLKAIASGDTGAAIRSAIVAHLTKSDRTKVRITDLGLALGETYSKAAITAVLQQLLEDGTVVHPEGARGNKLTTSVQLQDTGNTTPSQEADTNDDNGNTEG